jgi:hypothetical protein
MMFELFRFHFGGFGSAVSVRGSWERRHLARNERRQARIALQPGIFRRAKPRVIAGRMPALQLPRTKTA